MKSIPQAYQNDKKVSSSIKYFFKKYRVSSALRCANAYKSKGISAVLIYQYLFGLVFTNRSMYMNMLMGYSLRRFREGYCVQIHELKSYQLDSIHNLD
jgi:hypothetical protein